jgi:hypothetical protein
MNKHEVLSATDVMKAAAEGKPIQCRMRMGGGWLDTRHPQWDWFSYEYRVKLEPKTVYRVLDASGLSVGIYFDGKAKAENLLGSMQRRGIRGPYTLEVYRQIEEKT